MSTMALLISTDEWDKLEVFERFLANHPKAVWRTRGRYTPEYLRHIGFPRTLYFYHLQRFPKWDDRQAYYDRGQLGLLRVVDMPVASEQHR